MDCPICFCTFRPPIYQCIGGHSFCSHCCRKLKKCPTCARELTNVRNYTLEAVVEEMSMVECPNSNEGCRIRLHKEDVSQHVKQCDFSDYTCPMKFISVCDWKGKKCDFHQHVKTKHNWNMKNRFATAWTATYPRYPMSFHFLNGKMFYFYRLLKKDMLYWAVQHVGSDAEASNYHYEVIISKKNSKQMLVLSQACFSDELTPDQLVEGGLCVGVPLEALKKYEVKNGKFLCSVEVNMY